MTIRSRSRGAAGALAASAGAALGVYAGYAALTWCRYGRVPPPRDDQRDELLDRFMPTFDIVERHQIPVSAPAAVTLAAAREQDLLRLPLVRAIFRAREIALRAEADDRPQPSGLLAATLALGWGVLAEVPDREIVVGAVTKPWEADVIFRALPPGDFAAFAAPGFVKIVWTLRADPIDERRSTFRTETRAVATDATARARFRRYWAFASAGIVLIRRLSLGPLRRDAERRARSPRASTHEEVPHGEHRPIRRHDALVRGSFPSIATFVRGDAATETGAASTRDLERPGPNVVMDFEVDGPR